MSDQKTYKSHLDAAREAALQDRDGWWGKPIASYFTNHTETAELDLTRLKARVPQALSDLSTATEVKRFLLSEVEAYAELNLFKKLWWRLIKPMGFYLQLYGVLVLNEMARELQKENLKSSLQVYRSSALPKLVNFWDRVWKHWRSVLDDFLRLLVLDVSEKPAEVKSEAVHEERDSSQRITQSLVLSPSDPKIDPQTKQAETLPDSEPA